MADESRNKRTLQSMVVGFIVSVLLIVLGSIFFSLVEALNGDTKASAYHPGDPLPWWRQGQHLMTSHLLLIVVVCIVAGALAGWLRRPALDANEA